MKFDFEQMSDEEEQKKVLIITYYWPPSGGSGVQRWLKFVKYLPQFGWRPYVFTPENPSFDIKDESLLRDVPVEAEVLHFPIWEPYQIFNFLTGKKKTVSSANSAPKRDTLFAKLSIWIRGNLFIPDPRIFWVRPSVAFLDDFIREQKIKTIITTGPPHSMHLIGLRLKKRNASLKWIADFRDPWSEWGFLDTLPLLSITKSRIKALERNVLQYANEVITVTPSWVTMFERLGGRKVKLLTNGFDEDDFKEFRYEEPAKFTICHIGVVNEQCNPMPFMRAVKHLLQSNSDLVQNLCIRFIGDVKSDFINEIQSDPVLAGVTEFIPRVSHERIIDYYKSISLSLLILTGYKQPESYLPGKLFEYFAIGAPILGIGPEQGDAAKVIEKVSGGVTIRDENSEGIAMEIRKGIAGFNNSADRIPSSAIQDYSRRSITAKLTESLV